MIGKTTTSTLPVKYLSHSDIRTAVVLDSLDPDNRLCPNCGVNARWFTEDDVCVTCADDLLFALTGCRFGLPMNCNDVLHPDCFAD